MFRCQGCSARLKVPDESADKRVACANCAAVNVVPAAGVAFEVVDDEPAPVEDELEEDDRPPKKRKASAKKAGPPVGLLIGVGVGVVMVVGLVAYLLVSGKATGPGGILGPSAPAGYSVVGSSAIGVKMFLPGEVRGDYVRRGDRDGAPDPNYYSAHGMKGDPTGQMTARRSPGFKPAATPDQLFAAYEQAAFVNRPRKFEVFGKKAVTLGGKPGLEFRVKELPDLWDDTPENAKFFKASNDREVRRVEQEGRFFAILVTVNEEWTYVISIERRAKAVDDETVKTVSDSIRFN